ncbi:MAG: two-component regulator propeller domain-containing protein [Flavisolibacter sp.]
MQRSLFFLACSFISVCSFAQQYPFVYYTPREGLINSRVRGLRQDSKGRMYFLTYGGLSVYDGTRFNNYSTQDGLANEVVNDVAELSPDTILVSTNTTRLNMLVDGKISEYQTADHYYPIINRFLKSTNGQWYAVADEGLFLFKDQKFTRLPFSWKGQDIGLFLDYILEWKNYFLMIPWDSPQGVRMIVYDRDKKEVKDVLIDENTPMYAMDMKNRIWVLAGRKMWIMDSASMQQGKIHLVKVPAEYAAIIDPCDGVFFDREGNGWFYSANRIQKITPDFKKELITSEQGLQGGGVVDLFEDREETMWMVSPGLGAVKLKTTGVRLLAGFNSDRQMQFTSMGQAGDTTWFFSFFDRSIFRVVKKEIKRFPFLYPIIPMNIYPDGERLYVSDVEKIICIEDKNSDAAYVHPKVIAEDSLPNFANGLVDRYGNLIILTGRPAIGFSISVLHNHRFIMHYPVNYMNDQMAIDEEGRLWIASRNNELLCLSVHPESPVHYLQFAAHYSTGVPKMDPRSIAIKKNDLWIGTRYNGLFHFKLNGLKPIFVKQYTTKDGLTDNFIYSLSCDAAGNVWVGTQSGLDRMFIKQGAYMIANTSKNNNIFQSVFRIAALKDSTVWALNKDGSLIRIKFSQPVISPSPSLLLTSVRVNDVPIEKNKNRFSFQENNFSFSVAAPSFLDERSVRYSYFLEGGAHTGWSAASNVSSFNFVNLLPGSYVLHVKAEFSDAMYAPQTISYVFTILPAWWETWWFRLSLGLLTVGMITISIKNYFRRKFERERIMLEKKQAIEKERTRIATDMHDDLGAGLSRIKFLSETIGIKKQQQQPIEEEISKIREYSHQMIDKMGEIVWALNERNDSLSDLLAYTRAYAMEYLEQNGIACKVNIPEQTENIFLSGEFRRNIFLSVKEALHNVVKHAQANSVQIVISTGKSLEVMIRDDGQGFDLAHIRPFSNGLSNMENRMKEIGGYSEVRNHEGTSVKLSAPLV